MRATPLLLGLLLGAPSARAQDLGLTLSLELGTVHNSDPAWDLFSQWDGMPSRGIRGGVRIGPHLSVLGGWHRVRRGATVFVDGRGAYEAYTDGESFDTSVFSTAFFSDTFSLGAQLGQPIGQVLFPYVAADGLLMRGVMKLDADPWTRDNPNQLSAAGLAPGVLALGGLELRSPTEGVGVQLALFTELGYGAFTTATYGDFGPMQVGGFAARGGIGARF